MLYSCGMKGAGKSISDKWCGTTLHQYLSLLYIVTAEWSVVHALLLYMEKGAGKSSIKYYTP